MRQRLIIAGAAGLGLVGFLAIRQPLMPADGGEGLSLLSARIGVTGAVGLVALAGLPALVLGVLASASGNPLSGVFALALALTVLAGSGGSMRDWLWRADVPRAYGGLIIEMAIWQLGLLVMFGAIQYLRSPIRARLPALAASDHLGIDTHVRFPQLQSMGSGLLCALVSGAITCLLLPRGEVGQAIGALMIAFTIGGLVGQLVFPHANLASVLVSPSLVAIAGYAYVYLSFHSADSVLSAWYIRRLPGIALALPVFYASAALAGVTAGVGIAQSLEAARAHSAAKA